jgi:hypothetical protein
MWKAVRGMSDPINSGRGHRNAGPVRVLSGRNFLLPKNGLILRPISHSEVRRFAPNKIPPFQRVSQGGV